MDPSTNATHASSAQNDAPANPDPALHAAIEAASRHHFEGFRAAQRAVGGTPVPYDKLSERTRRIRENQVRGMVEAALAAALPHLREQIAGRITANADTIESFAKPGATAELIAFLITLPWSTS